jgi:hypothetical protein
MLSVAQQQIAGPRHALCTKQAYSYALASTLASFARSIPSAACNPAGLSGCLPPIASSRRRKIDDG